MAEWVLSADAGQIIMDDGEVVISETNDIFDVEDVTILIPDIPIYVEGGRVGVYRVNHYEEEAMIQDILGHLSLVPTEVKEYDDGRGE